MAGVDQHSQWARRPRVAGSPPTSAYVLTTTYGDRAHGHGPPRNRVRKIPRMGGAETDPVTGRRYEAGDPRSCSSGCTRRWSIRAWSPPIFYGTPLSAADKDAYVAEMTAAAELVGVPAGRASRPPVAELDAFLHRRPGPELTLSPGAAAIAAYLFEHARRRAGAPPTSGATSPRPTVAALARLGPGSCTASATRFPPDREAVRQVARRARRDLPR